ncbi:MAG: lytic transglycosylase domain-containing protein [Bdellovibrionales bacterium]|nr:lytic transglycosylase domain-containing protein [Bdellovibrionales bacterium]
MRANWASPYLRPAAGRIPSGRIIQHGTRWPLFSDICHKIRPGAVALTIPQGRLQFFSLFLLSASGALMVFLAALVNQSHNAELPSIIARSVPSISWDSWVPAFQRDQEYNFTLQQRREMASQLHFVREIIQNQFKRSDAEETAQIIVQESMRAGVDPLFVAAVVKAESSFKRNARSPVGAQGLMQVMPATGKFITKIRGLEWQGSGKLYEAKYNVRVGIAYLDYLKKLFDHDMQKVLVAYNWGPANLEKSLRGEKRPPSSTLKYAKTILGDHQKWRSDLHKNRAKYKYMGTSFLLS